MAKLLNPLMMLVFKINYFPGQMGFKLTVTEHIHQHTGH